jgi:hypothetical protein
VQEKKWNADWHRKNELEQISFQVREFYYKEGKIFTKEHKRFFKLKEFTTKARKH